MAAKEGLGGRVAFARGRDGKLEVDTESTRVDMRVMSGRAAWPSCPFSPSPATLLLFGVDGVDGGLDIDIDDGDGTRSWRERLPSTVVASFF